MASSGAGRSQLDQSPQKGQQQDRRPRRRRQALLHQQRSVWIIPGPDLTAATALVLRARRLTEWALATVARWRGSRRWRM